MPSPIAPSDLEKVEPRIHGAFCDEVSKLGQFDILVASFMEYVTDGCSYTEDFKADLAESDCANTTTTTTAECDFESETTTSTSTAEAETTTSTSTAEAATTTTTSACAIITSHSFETQTASAPYPYEVVIADVVDPVDKITVSLSTFSHDFPADLFVLLVSPLGKKILLMANQGSGVPVENLDFIFDETAAADLPDTGPLLSGTFLPYGGTALTEALISPAPALPYSNTLAEMAAEDVNGTWEVYVSSGGHFEDGSICEVSINIETVTTTTTSTTTAP